MTYETTVMRSMTYETAVMWSMTYALIPEIRMTRKLLPMAAILFLAAAMPPVAWAQKERLSASIMSHEQEMWQTAQQIWQWAEPGYQEHRSSKLLSDTLENTESVLEFRIAPTGD